MGKKSAINYRLLMENTTDVICLIGLDLEMSYASPSCTEMLGWEPEELCSRWPRLVVDMEYLPVLEQARRQEFEIEPLTLKMFKKDGSFAWIEITAKVVKASDSEFEGIVLTMRDVTARLEREEQLQQLSQADGLTGLGNRRSFDQGLENEWRRAWRDHSELSLLLIDIDFFKYLNDHSGHLVGDDCLKAVADEIRQTFHRSSDVVARYGGEEFAVILPHTSAAGARMQAEKIRENIERLRIPNPARPDDRRWITVSIGVGTAVGGDHRHISSPQSLLQHVDDALYSAKSHGRNRVWAAAPGRVRHTFTTQHNRRSTDRLDLDLNQKESRQQNDTVN